MTLAVFTVCERVRLSMGSVSMVGRWDLVRCAMGSSRLRGIGLSGGLGMTTLGSGAGGCGMTNLGDGEEGFFFTVTGNSSKDGARLRACRCSGCHPTLDCLL